MTPVLLHLEPMLARWARAYLQGSDEAAAWTALEEAGRLLPSDSPYRAFLTAAGGGGSLDAATSHAALLVLANVGTREIAARVGADRMERLVDHAHPEAGLLEKTSPSAWRRAWGWVQRNVWRPREAERARLAELARQERRRQAEEVRRALEPRWPALLASRWGGLYTLAQELGGVTQDEYADGWEDPDADPPADFRDADSHCSRCCERSKKFARSARRKSAPCAGCVGEVGITEAGYGPSYFGLHDDGPYLWYIDCEWCGRIDEEFEPELKRARYEAAIEAQERPWRAREAARKRMAQLIDGLKLTPAARALVEGAEERWTGWDEPLSTPALLVAAWLSGAPAADLRDVYALLDQDREARGFLEWLTRGLSDTLDELYEEDQRLVAGAFQRAARASRRAGLVEEAGFWGSLREKLRLS